jgi:hypothetical protein
MPARHQMAGIVIAIALLLAGCVQSEFVTPSYTSPQQAYIDKAMASPLDVNVGKNQIEDAWGRTQAFISKYSDMKLQTVSDYSIQTFNSYRIFMYGYTATKTPTKDGFTITVDCSSAASHTHSTEERILYAVNLNAHILSYYVETGELPFPELIGRFATRRQLTAPSITPSAGEE